MLSPILTGHSRFPHCLGGSGPQGSRQRILGTVRAARVVLGRAECPSLFSGRLPSRSRGTPRGRAVALSRCFPSAVPALSGCPACQSPCWPAQETRLAYTATLDRPGLTWVQGTLERQVGPECMTGAGPHPLWTRNTVSSLGIHVILRPFAGCRPTWGG